MIDFSLAERNTRLPFPLLPKTCHVFTPDVIFITCERRPKSNNSSSWRLTVGCTHTKWLSEDGLIWHNLFCADGICSNPLPAALPRHCYCWKARRFNQWWVNPKSSILLKQKRLFVWKWSWIGPHLFLRQTSHCYFLLTSGNLSKYCNNTISMILSKTLNITYVIYIILHN